VLFFLIIISESQIVRLFWKITCSRTYLYGRLKVWSPNQFALIATRLKKLRAKVSWNRWNSDSAVTHQCVSDELKGFYSLWIIEETNQVLAKLGLELVHKDHLSVFTFSDTNERFGFAKLVTDGENSDIQVMSLDSTSSLSSSSFPVETKDEKALVIELLPKFTKPTGQWDVKELTSHWNMICELMRLGTLPQRQINPKHHSQIAKYLKTLDEKYARYSTSADKHDEIECLREQLQRPNLFAPPVIPTKTKIMLSKALVAGIFLAHLLIERYTEAWTGACRRESSQRYRGSRRTLASRKDCQKIWQKGMPRMWALSDCFPPTTPIGKHLHKR
jgi:hypothetical protein